MRPDLVVVLAAASAALAVAAAADTPVFPTCFRTNVSIVAHLVDRTLEYPPWLRKIELWYDFPNGRAKAVVHKGLDEGKTFLRRYDAKKEFMVRGGEYPECRRAYLGEAMPVPELPSSLRRERTLEDRNGRSCQVWRTEDEYARVSVFVDDEFGVPLSVTDEQFVDGKLTPVMTYQFDDIVLEDSIPESDFAVPAPYFSAANCTRHVGGYPYLHLFHIFLMI